MRKNSLTSPLKLACRLACGFMLLALAACQVFGPGTPPAPTGTPAPTRTPAPKPTATPTLPPYLRVDPSGLRGVQIRFLHPWAGETAETIQSLAEAFNRSNEWGFRVQVDSAGGTGMLFQEVNEMEAGDWPNLIAAPGEYLFTWNRADANAFVNLDEYIFHSRWGLADEQIDDFLPAFWQQDVTGEVRLGVPLLRNPALLLYNLSWAQELGFYRAPATPEEFREQACAAALANRSDRTIGNDGTGGWIVETGSVTMWSWLRGFGADPSPAGSGEYHFASPESEQAFAFLRALVDENCAWKSRLAEPYDYFANRQALFYSGDLEDTLAQARAMDRLERDDQWTAIPYPSLDGDPVVVAGGPSLAITSASPEEQLAAWLFARWLLAPERLAEITAAAGGLPVTKSARAEMQVFGGQHPQWRAALTYWEQIQTPPANAGWRVVRPLLEDAGYQALLPSVEPGQIPEVLTLLDEMILELAGAADGG